MTQQTFSVQGMSCGHCRQAVTNAVKSVDPAAEVTVDLGTGQVQVQTAKPRDAIAQAIAAEGYAVAD